MTTNEKINQLKEEIKIREQEIIKLESAVSDIEEKMRKPKNSPYWVVETVATKGHLSPFLIKDYYGDMSNNCFYYCNYFDNEEKAAFVSKKLNTIMVLEWFNVYDDKYIKEDGDSKSCIIRYDYTVDKFYYEYNTNTNYAFKKLPYIFSAHTAKLVCEHLTDLRHEGVI